MARFVSVALAAAALLTMVAQAAEPVATAAQAVELVTAAAQVAEPVATAAQAVEPVTAAAQVAELVTTASGLIYQSLKEGSGASPGPTDRVQLHYRGYFPDSGKEFDSSIQHGQAMYFSLNGMIPCWAEALQMMKVGGKAKLTCPPAIAYGSRCAGGVTPPNATLNFEVELLGVTGK